MNEVAQATPVERTRRIRRALFQCSWFLFVPLAIQQVQPFRASSELVVLHVSVRDKKGQPIEHLSQDAFAVLEDGKPRPIAVFMAEDEPVTIGLLIDNSISMQRLRDRVISAAVAFARASRPEDEFFALAFNEHVRPALPETMPFTSDAAELQAALMASITARGQTALFDAVSMGIDYAGRGRHQRKSLVVVSDGGDNASQSSFDEVLRRARSSNVLIHGLVLVDPLADDTNPKVLKALAEATGGETVTPDNDREITRAFERIAGAIRHAYTIGFTPATPDDGQFHKLRVTVSGDAARGAEVRARVGYLAMPHGSVR